MVVWIMGLSGAGKSTLANSVVNLVRQRQKNIVLLDGDLVRAAFGNDLGYSIEDRRKNADRFCRLSKLLSDQGIHVVCAILSLFSESRQWNRENIENYREVYIDTPLQILQKRDSKGIYNAISHGKVSNVVGIDIVFEEPTNCELKIHNNGSLTDLLSHTEQIASWLQG